MTFQYPSSCNQFIPIIIFGLMHLPKQQLTVLLNALSLTTISSQNIGSLKFSLQLSLKINLHYIVINIYIFVYIHVYINFYVKFN